MKLRQNYLTLFVLFVLVICRVSAFAHAVEHTFEDHDDYCEVCSLVEHNSDGLVSALQTVFPYDVTESYSLYQSPLVTSQHFWDYLSRAPPVYS